MVKDFYCENENWFDAQWRNILEQLVVQGILTWKEIATLTYPYFLQKRSRNIV